MKKTTTAQSLRAKRGNPGNKIKIIKNTAQKYEKSGLLRKLAMTLYKPSSTLQCALVPVRSECFCAGKNVSKNKGTNRTLRYVFLRKTLRANGSFQYRVNDKRESST